MLNLKQLAQYSLSQSRELQSQVLNAMRDAIFIDCKNISF